MSEIDADPLAPTRRKPTDDPKAALTREQLLDFVQRRGADGEPLLTTEEFWRHWPNARG